MTDGQTDRITIAIVCVCLVRRVKRVKAFRCLYQSVWTENCFLSQAQCVRADADAGWMQ